MNETLQAIQGRYSCRSFLSELPDDEQIQAIARAANQSPSAMNLQPWQIIVVRNAALMEELQAEGMRTLSALPDKTTFQQFAQNGGKLFYNAPCMIFVPMDGNAPASRASLDCGIVSQTIALAAQSLGLATCICGMARLAFSEEKAAYFKEKLQFPDGYEFGISVLIGKAAQAGAAHEPSAEKITFVDWNRNIRAARARPIYQTRPVFAFF